MAKKIIIRSTDPEGSEAYLGRTNGNTAWFVLKVVGGTLATIAIPLLIFFGKDRIDLAKSGATRAELHSEISELEGRSNSHFAEDSLRFYKIETSYAKADEELKARLDVLEKGFYNRTERFANIEREAAVLRTEFAYLRQQNEEIKRSQELLRVGQLELKELIQRHFPPIPVVPPKINSGSNR